jgi:hypothetical protein
LPVAEADYSPVLTVAAHGHHVHGNSPLVAPAVRANFLPNVAIVAHASNLPVRRRDLPTVAFSAHGHHKRGDSLNVALATRHSYSPDVALTTRR